MSKKLLFIWLPKCYGTSTWYLLREKIGMLGFFKQHEEDEFPFHNDNHITFSHSSIKRLVELEVVTKEFYDNSFKFTFVRNPYERAVSLFFYQKNKDWTFKEFIKYLYDNQDLITPISEMNVSLFPWADGNLFQSSSQWNKQVAWIPDDIDFIGKVENYKEDLDKMLKIAEVDIGDYEVFDVNKSDHGDYREYYDEETKKLITEMYKEDLERFNYEF